jgi:monoamine oxidase
LRPTLAVVGTGFAGLIAGFLLARDFKVVVFEARRRVGGRVHSMRDGTGRATEAGGELIGYARAFWMRLSSILCRLYSQAKALRIALPFGVPSPVQAFQPGPAW